MGNEPRATRARYVVAGGGTGGHVFPGLAVANCLREGGDEVTFVGTSHGLEARLAPQNGFQIEFVHASGLVGVGLKRKVTGAFTMARGVIEAFGLLRRLAPAAILGVGGYASAPVLAAAALRGIPTVVHEQNAIAGWTNRVLAPFARTVCTSFPATKFRSDHIISTGNPVRADFFQIPPPEPTAGRLRILVVGGSQGSRVLNRNVPAAFGHSLLADTEVEVVHQIGPLDSDLVATGWKAVARDGLTVEVHEFISDLAERYAWADLVVCRAGATTVFELAAAGRAAVLIPFAAATNSHQSANARALEKAGAAIVIPQAEFNGGRLALELAPFAYDPPKIIRWGEAARTLARPEAAADVAASLRVAGGRP